MIITNNLGLNFSLTDTYSSYSDVPKKFQKLAHKVIKNLDLETIQNTWGKTAASGPVRGFYFYYTQINYNNFLKSNGRLYTIKYDKLYKH